MTIVDLMAFIAEHDDHHLVTITQLLNGVADRRPHVPGRRPACR
jgi:hypothetical protein